MRPCEHMLEEIERMRIGQIHAASPKLGGHSIRFQSGLRLEFWGERALVLQHSTQPE